MTQGRPASGLLRAALVAMVAAGAATFAVALDAGAAVRAWEAFLVNLLFFMGIAQGGVAVSASFYLTQGRWGGASAYRLAESFFGFLPVGFVLFWILFLGRDTIFPWVLHPIARKAAWLNLPFLFARDGGGLALMTGLSFAFVGLSRRRDAIEWAQSPGNIEMPPAAIRRLAPALLIAYAIVYSLLAFDLVMSLAPQWRSTLFGAYFFAGAYWSGLAAMGLAAVFIWRPRAADVSRMFHDIGKMVFAFSVFWAYLMFSQYLPIWYGDIPVETFFVVPRVQRMPWGSLGWSAFILIWALPFVVLMGRRPKRTPAILGAVCALGLVGMWLERYVLIAPSLSPHAIPFGWVEALVTLGFVGAFGLCARPGLQLVPRVPFEAPGGAGR